MNLYTRHNDRRFFRQDLGLKYYLFPKLFFSDTEILTNGINYFNQSTEDTVEELKDNVRKELRLIRHHQTVFQNIVSEIFDHFDIVLNYLRMINQGINIRRKKSYWRQRGHVLKGFQSIQGLKQDASKTYALFKKIEKKFVFYTQMIQETIDRSSETELHFSDFPEILHFKEEIAQEFLDQEIDITRSNLLQMIIQIERLFSAGLKPFTHLAADYLLYNREEIWIPRPVNISACGLAFYDERAYPLLQWVDIKLYLEEFDEIITFEGKIVRTHYDAKKKLNFTAMDFYFPLASYQKELISYMQLKEIKQAMEIRHHARHQS